MKPVVLVPRSGLLSLVMNGATRAGREPTVTVAGDGHRSIDVLDPGMGTEMAVAVLEDRASMSALASKLAGWGARPIPVLLARLHLGADPECLTWLEKLPPGLNVAIPSLDDDGERHLLWSSLRVSGAAERHHLVEVDGRPGLDGPDTPGPSEGGDLLRDLAAGAAGVLAGRMVAANRRWQGSIQD